MAKAVRVWSVALSILLGLGLIMACGGGGGGGDRQPSNFLITGIELEPAELFAGNTVRVSFTFVGQRPEGDATWTVGAGTLSATPPAGPDLFTRASSQAGPTVMVGDSLYWTLPDTPGTYGVQVTLGDQTKTLNVSVEENPLAISVVTQEDGDIRVEVAVKPTDAFFQAAFRVVFDPQRFIVVRAEPGDFIQDPLFFALTDHNGFVPIAVSVKGQDAPRPSGSGVIARVILRPVGNSTSGMVYLEYRK